MSSLLLAVFTGLALIALSLWSIRRGLRIWGIAGFGLAIMIVAFGYWSDDLESDEGESVSIPVEATLPSIASPAT